MIRIKPDYYNNFKCLMGACPSSCCEKWQVVIDAPALDYYNGVQGDFGNRLRKEIVFDNGDYCFNIHSGRCAFLNRENLCDIHCNLGQENMAKTCRKYPDFTVENDTVTVYGQSVSCPFVAEEIIRHRDRLNFITEGVEEQDKYEKAFCHILFSLIDIAQNRDIPIKERITLLLKKGELLQNNLCSEFDVEEVFPFKDNKGLTDYCDTLSSLEYLTNEGKGIVDDLSTFAEQNVENITKAREAFAEYMNGREYEYEQIWVYFLFRYFMEYLGEGNVMLPLRFALFSTRVIYFAGIMHYRSSGKFTVDDQIKLCYLYGKEIEHSQNNLDIIFDDLSLGII